MIERFWNWVDTRLVVRRIMMFGGAYFTFQCYAWMFAYANAHEASVGTAAVVTAVTGPVSALQAAIFKFYADNRSQT